VAAFGSKVCRRASLAGVWLLAASASLGAATAANHKPAPQPDHRALRAQAAQALILRGDADSLATSAALSFKLPTSPSALELAVGAAEAAPQNAAIGWLHLQICVATPSCDVRDAATVLRWVDADNSASWLPILTVAVKDKDTMEVERVLGDMAQAPRFDLYWNELVVLMTDALKNTRGALPHGFASSDAERFDLISGIVSELVPAFSSLLDACRAAPPGTERRENCLKLSRIMQHGDTVVAQIAGFGIERRLLASDSREMRALAERRRELEWRVSAAAQFDAPVLPWLSNTRARLRLAKMRNLPREEDVCIAILREHKIPVEPKEAHR
jgi:hypothetical protein